ncbi:MAG: TonB-dependent receptor [Sphingobacteriales bacterium]|nr:TonB-dependent receptor [Sphingobacteriales bacterium]MBI3716967.1 TonB-dependent receptor [Sphingobacteriales bacterium]
MKKGILKGTGILLLLAPVLIFAQSHFEEAVKTKLVTASGKNVFSGKITDKATSKPLAGVSVYFNDLKTGAVTDAEGNFSVNNIPSGKHLVEISYVGYGTISEYVEFNNDVKKDYSLSLAVIENDAVIVTGVSSATQLKKSPVAVSLIRKQDLFNGVAPNLIEALTKKGGIATVSTGPAIAKPVIRGLGYNRVVVLNDGVRQEGQQWGDEHGIEIDELSVTKVEILKGPSSLIYGSDAMAGVINIITNSPIANNTIKGNLFSNYQTNNRLRSYYGNIAGNTNGFNWNLYGTYKAAADYKNKYDGYVLNSKFKDRNFGGYVGYNGGWGFSHLIFSRFNQTLGIVEGNRDDDGYFVKPVAGGGEVRGTDADFKSINPLVPFQDITHTKYVSDNSFNIGKSRLTAVIGFQENQRTEHGNADDPSAANLSFDLKTVTENIQFHFPEKNNWRTSIGASGMQQNNTNKGEERLIPNYDLTDEGVFIFSKKQIDKLTLSGGVRFDTRTVNGRKTMEGSDEKFASFSKSFSNLSGSVGLSYEANKNVLFRFNLARGYRAPSLPELSSNGEHKGTNRYEYGNLNLKSETSFQADAGMEVNNEHISVQLNLYDNNVNNFIFYQKLASVNGGDSLVGNATAFKFEQRKANLAGIELNLDIHPHPLDWLHFENTFSYVSGRFSEAVDGTKNMPLIPPARLISQLRGDFLKKGKLIRNFSISGELDNTFKQNRPFTAFNTETATKGYTLVNAGINAELMNKSKTICSISFNVMNLTDVAYQNHLSRLKYTAENLVTGRTGVFNMGRNFSVKVNIPLEFKLKS